MIAALAYLQFNSWKNHLLVRIRRLRQPKYLLGAIFGAAYFYFYFIRHIFTPRSQSFSNYLTAEHMVGLEMLGAFVLLLVVLMSWIFPKKRAALNFNEAEVAFLFTAPVSRGTLIQYKLITAQVALLLTSFFLTLISGRFKTSAYFWMPLLSYWLMFATLSLHFLAASFLRTMLFDRGLSLKRWRVVAVLVAVGVIAAMIVSARHAVATFDISRVDDIRSLATELIGVFNAGATPYLLLPFRMLIKPLFATEPIAFLIAAAPVAIVFALQYIWVVRMNVAFEEASIEHSKKRAELMSAARRGQWKVTATKPRRAWFQLSPIGKPFVAIFWKNLISMGNAFQRRTLITLAIVALVPFFLVANVTRNVGGGSIVGFMALMFLAWSALLGPTLMRQDFRQDFLNADLLKLFPLRGWQIALGELMTPVVVLTLIQWFLLLVAAIFIDFKALDRIPYLTRFIFVGGTAVVLPLLTLLTLTIPNMAVLIFPAWFQVGRDAPQGIEATGQRLVLMLGQVLMVTLALLPVVAIGGIAGGVGYYISGLGLAAVAATISSTIILALESTLMIWWLGKSFEKLDLAKEGSS